MTLKPHDSNPNIVGIDIDAAASNLRALSGRLKNGAQIMPVVKSDAYGHGLVDISRRLIQEKNVWGLGISLVQEAYELRSAGITSRIFLLSGCFPGEERAVAELNVVAGVVSVEMMHRLQEAADRINEHIHVHIKVDTGMGRYGLWPEELVRTASCLNKWPNLIFDGLYTHMPVSDRKGDPFNLSQINLFSTLVARVREAGWDPEYIHMANSAAIINFPDSHFNLVRPGIGIYGSLPGDMNSEEAGLRPVMSFESTLASVKKVAAMTPIGYGHAARVEKNSVVAVVPAGYDDGYTRSLSCRGQVLVKGVRCDILGRICMKAFMVNVTDVPEPAAGDRVVMIGSSGSETVGVDDLASWAGTISYELMCLIGSRNPRINI
jgi:alanine racemase